VLIGLPANAHGVGHPVEPGLHRVEDAFVFPPLDPLQLVRCTAGLERTGEKCGQMLIMVDVEPAIQSDAPSRQLLTGRVGVLILLGVVDEVLREHRLRRLSSPAAGAVREG
jgi:hypothetical protein